MKEIILKLHAENKSIPEIAKIVGRCYATVQYHLNPTEKKRVNESKTQRVQNARIKLKMEFGGQCSICGYNKSLKSLHFHHMDDNKENSVSRALYNGYEAGLKEASKCQLVCANCHGEIHDDSL